MRSIAPDGGLITVHFRQIIVHDKGFEKLKVQGKSGCHDSRWPEEIKLWHDRNPGGKLDYLLINYFILVTFFVSVIKFS